ncbi:MAG: RidA family protein [Pseudomonadota bacterium]
MITRIETDTRMSLAVVRGDTAYLSGVCGEGPDVATQTCNALSEVDRLLALAGTDASQVLSAQIWLADKQSFEATNAVWDAWLTPGSPPARACVESRLAGAEWLVEVMVVAHVPAGSANVLGDARVSV